MKKNIVFIFAIILFVGVFLLISIVGKIGEERESAELDFKRRKAIQTAYPEYSIDYEKQPCFAGCSVIVSKEGNDYYYAYIIHGSGVPIAEATCFRVDSMMKVYKIGKFPDFTDSYIGYTKIDAKTCKGIK